MNVRGATGIGPGQVAGKAIGALLVGKPGHPGSVSIFAIRPCQPKLDLRPRQRLAAVHSQHPPLQHIPGADCIALRRASHVNRTNRSGSVRSHSPRGQPALASIDCTSASWRAFRPWRAFARGVTGAQALSAKTAISNIRPLNTTPSPSLINQFLEQSIVGRCHHGPGEVLDHVALERRRCTAYKSQPLAGLGEQIRTSLYRQAGCKVRGINSG